MLNNPSGRCRGTSLLGGTMHSPVGTENVVTGFSLLLAYRLKNSGMELAKLIRCVLSGLDKSQNTDYFYGHDGDTFTR